VDAVQLPAGDREVSRRGRATGKQHSVELLGQACRGKIVPDIDSRPEGDALFGQLVDTTLHHALVQLKVGYA
jgi:hypothetical protein